MQDSSRSLSQESCQRWQLREGRVDAAFFRHRIPDSSVWCIWTPKRRAVLALFGDCHQSNGGEAILFKEEITTMSIKNYKSKSPATAPNWIEHHDLLPTNAQFDLKMQRMLFRRTRLRINDRFCWYKLTKQGLFGGALSKVFRSFASIHSNGYVMLNGCTKRKLEQNRDCLQLRHESHGNKCRLPVMYRWEYTAWWGSCPEGVYVLGVLTGGATFLASDWQSNPCGVTPAREHLFGARLGLNFAH